MTTQEKLQAENALQKAKAQNRPVRFIGQGITGETLKKEYINKPKKKKKK